MIQNLPEWINYLFLLTTFVVIVIFHFANGRVIRLTLLIIVWSLLQSFFAYIGFYTQTELIPPRIILVLIPVLIILCFGLLEKQRFFILQNRNISLSTFLHTARIPVEMVLFYLFIDKMIPQIMTFEGWNFDILVGVSAPIIGILWLRKNIGINILLLWNFLALALVLFIFAIAILSSTTPIQIFGFEQPNVAVNYFPFILLPSTIVPIVIYTHIIDIIKLWQTKRNNSFL